MKTLTRTGRLLVRLNIVIWLMIFATLMTGCYFAWGGWTFVTAACAVMIYGGLCGWLGWWINILIIRHYGAKK